MSATGGHVVSIHIAGTAGGGLHSVESALALPGRGLDGDRYCKKQGTYSAKPGAGRDVTLIEVEALEALARDYNAAIEPGQSRRNIVIRGVALNHLVGREFTVGAVRLRGCRLCEPCGYLAKMTSDTVSKGLIHRGGLRCDIVTEGTIQVGDEVQMA